MPSLTLDVSVEQWNRFAAALEHDIGSPPGAGDARKFVFRRIREYVLAYERAQALQNLDQSGFDVEPS